MRYSILLIFRCLLPRLVLRDLSEISKFCIEFMEDVRNLVVAPTADMLLSILKHERIGNS